VPFVTASDGVELYYEVEGDGFPLVFTHGNMGFGRQFVLQTRDCQRSSLEVARRENARLTL
jgi:pimeloyl-ACP methyl ester carboxylesterase